jgi:glycosyltransferase involved in cell wall biosynthesis
LPITDSQLVTVVIPAYNAAATLDETLRSVRSQTHHALEIIVVDDGSTDDTRIVALRHAAADDRVQVVTQVNAGVAAARNTGWRRARAELIAFVDADDLWAPMKIERQIQALQAGGSRVGLVYCWFARIDREGTIIGMAKGERYEGMVLDRIFVGNFVGNGSSILIRRQALIDAQGFDSCLRAAGAEGCEDFLLYCRIAENYHYAVVPEHLIGYRCLPNNMSSKRSNMLRSWLLVRDEMIARHPDQRDTLRVGLRSYGSWLVRDMLASAGPGELPLLLLVLFRRHPLIAAKVLLKDVPLALIGTCRAWLRERYQQERPVTAGSGCRFPVGDLEQCH